MGCCSTSVKPTIPLLLIAGVTKPSDKHAMTRNGTKARNNPSDYLQGISHDMSKMEDFVLQNDNDFELFNAVRNMKNLKKKTVIQEIENLAKLSSKHEAIGIYYTGHGNEKGDWCFADGNVKWKNIKKLLKQNNGKLILLLDSCYSGNWAQNLKQLEGKVKEVVIFAGSKPDEVAWDIPTSGGTATTYWLEHLAEVFEGEASDIVGCVGLINENGEYNFEINK
eukprot:336554_1